MYQTMTKKAAITVQVGNAHEHMENVASDWLSKPLLLPCPIHPLPTRLSLGPSVPETLGPLIYVTVEL